MVIDRCRDFPCLFLRRKETKKCRMREKFVRRSKKKEDAWLNTEYAFSTMDSVYRDWFVDSTCLLRSLIAN